MIWYMSHITWCTRVRNFILKHKQNNLKWTQVEIISRHWTRPHSTIGGQLSKGLINVYASLWRRSIRPWEHCICSLQWLTDNLQDTVHSTELAFSSLFNSIFYLGHIYCLIISSVSARPSPLICAPEVGVLRWGSAGEILTPLVWFDVWEALYKSGVNPLRHDLHHRFHLSVKCSYAWLRAYTQVIIPSFWQV